MRSSAVEIQLGASPARGRRASPSPGRCLWMVTPRQVVGGLRREQQVVDADAVVPLPGAGLVVPEGVAARRAVGLHVGVGEAEPLQRPERRRGSRAGTARRPSTRPGRRRRRARGSRCSRRRAPAAPRSASSSRGVRLQPLHPAPACRRTCRCRSGCRWAGRWRRRGRDWAPRPPPRCSGRDRRRRRRAGPCARPPAASSRAAPRRCSSSGRGRRRCSQGFRRLRRGNFSSTHLISCRQATSGCGLAEPGQDGLQPRVDRIDVPGGDAHGTSLGEGTRIRHGPPGHC